MTYLNSDIIYFDRIQEEREERHKYKGSVRTPMESELDLFLKSDIGSFDNGDPTTTNLYLGNLNPKVCTMIRGKSDLFCFDVI